MHTKPSLKVSRNKEGTDHNMESLIKPYSLINKQQAKNKAILVY